MTEEQKQDTPEQAEFRAYARDWLQRNHPGQPPMLMPQSVAMLRDPEAFKWLQKWQGTAYKGGLIGCDYPVEVGGAGRQDCQRIANEEMGAAKVPSFPNIVGLGIGAPSIFYHAQDSVKRDRLPKLFSGEEMWCQGFSEPNAGSDLANQQTFARRDGDNWVINGHKVWTTLAHFSDWMVLLCRTDKADKYKGLSYFVVPIKANLGKGVTVRPLIKMSGKAGFNEVLLDDLVIPDEYRLGDVGAGWTVAMTALTHERDAGSLVTPAAGDAYINENTENSTNSLSTLINTAKVQAQYGKDAAQDPLLRDEIVKLHIRKEGLTQNSRRARVPALIDNATRIQLQHKLVNSEISQDLGKLGSQALGLASTLDVADAKAPDNGAWPTAYMESFAATIAAGTSEIQRNILGERVLGLPKSK